MTLVERKTFDYLSTGKKSMTKFSRMIIAYVMKHLKDVILIFEIVQLIIYI